MRTVANSFGGWGSQIRVGRAPRRPSVPVGVLALALLLAPMSGCCSCDLEGEVRQRAGAGAVDCGFASLGEDVEPIAQCALDAQAAGTSAYGGWEELGIDSEVHQHFAVGGEQAWIFLFDGDPSGGDNACASLTAFPCQGALVSAGARLGCDGIALDPIDLCD